MTDPCSPLTCIAVRFTLPINKHHRLCSRARSMLVVVAWAHSQTASRGACTSAASTRYEGGWVWMVGWWPLVGHSHVCRGRGVRAGCVCRVPFLGPACLSSRTFKQHLSYPPFTALPHAPDTQNPTRIGPRACQADAGSDTGHKANRTGRYELCCVSGVLSLLIHPG